MFTGSVNKYPDFESLESSRNIFGIYTYSMFDDFPQKVYGRLEEKIILKMTAITSQFKNCHFKKEKVLNVMYHFKCKWWNWKWRQNITRKKHFFPLENKVRKMKDYKTCDFRSIFDDFSWKTTLGLRAKRIQIGK